MTNRAEDMRHWNIGYFFCLAAVVIALSLAVSGQAQSDPWLILTNGEAGSINCHTTREDLVRLYGTANVVDQEVDVGEGDVESVTIVFPNVPQRSIEISWKDPSKKTIPERARIWGKASRWHAAHGISLGTSLTELNRLNGRPFVVGGFGTDEPGWITSWRGGSLEELETPGGRGVVLQLDYTVPRGMRVTLSDVNGDSHRAVIQKLNFRVREISWMF